MSEVEAIRETVREVARHLEDEVLAVGIFGSMARGDFGERSDVDIFVITCRPFSLEEQDHLYRVFGRAVIPHFGRDVTVLVYDVESLRRVPTWHTLMMIRDAQFVDDRAGVEALFRRILNEAEAQGIMYDAQEGVFRVCRKGWVVFSLEKQP